ncbi:MAG: hypothetical protein FJX65_16825 [Alphaproteobacteria bacterium]|nr:hypothetical protein [Alphaproteobacteria bacterium]
MSLRNAPPSAHVSSFGTSTDRVIGLGYVGLPPAIALARHYRLVGYDLSERRVASLRAGHDRTHEVADADVAATTCRFESTAKAMADSDA